MSDPRYPPLGMMGPRVLAWWALRRYADAVRIEGIERVPASGPVLLAARHVHHLLDGAVLLRAVPRPVHVVVALDWTPSARARRAMELLCAWARWPVIVRPSMLGAGGFAAWEAARYVRRGLREAARRLADGRVVAIFPEGRPAIDPAPGAAAPRDRDGFLPFARGFTTLARLARRAGARDLAIVPVGFRYERAGFRWRIVARFGAALPDDAALATVEQAVRELSAAP